MYTCLFGMNGISGTRSLAPVLAKLALFRRSSSKLDMTQASPPGWDGSEGQAASNRSELCQLAAPAGQHPEQRVVTIMSARGPTSS